MESGSYGIMDNFDTRIKSGFSINGYSSTFKKEIDDILNQIKLDIKSLNKTNLEITNIKKINSIIKNTNFTKKYGKVENFKISLDYFILSTSDSYLIIFDFELNLLNIINVFANETSNAEAGKMNYIESIDIYFNSLLVGTKRSIMLYELTSFKLLTTITTNYHDCNVNLKLLDEYTFLSSDKTKLLKHKISLHLFTYTHKATQLINLNNNVIHDFKILPLSYKKSKIEDLQIVACITDSFLLVIGLNPLITYIKLKVPRKLSNYNNINLNKCIWFPEYKDEEGHIHHNPRLLYSSNHILSLIEINDDIQVVNKKKRLILDDNIKSIHWLNSKLIIAIIESINNENDKSQTVYLIDPDNFKILNSSKFINFHNDIQIFKSHIFLINDSNFFSVAKLTTFSDYIRQFPSDLFKLYTALELFTSHDSYYLQFTKGEIRKTLIDLILAKPKDDFIHISASGYCPYLLLCFQTIIKLKDPELYSKVFVNYPNNNYGEFFKIMKECIKIGKINRLPPDVLQQFIISNKGDSSLEFYLCLLDIKELDLDLILKFRHLKNLKAYIYGKLFNDYVTCFVEFIEDIKVHLYSSEFFDKLPEPNEKINQNIIYKYLTYVLTNRQYPLENAIRQDTNNIKKVLYNIIFSGTSLELPFNSNSYLFVSENPINNEPAFPYISLLLKYNCSECLKMLNEVFEDDFFNQEDGSNILEADNNITRQYIIEILVNIYNNDTMHIFSTDEFYRKGDEGDDKNLFDSLLNKIYLSIFILRNYPKYYQVIKINDNLILNLIENFYNLKVIRSGHSEQDFSMLKDDVELSLMNLIEVYNLHNFEFYYYFEQNEFFRVLFQLYKVDNNIIDLLKLWLNHDLTNYSIIRILNIISSLMTRDNSNVDFFNLVSKNFVTIITDKHRNNCDFQEIIMALQKIDESLNENIFKVNDENSRFIKYKYLKDIIDLQTNYSVDIRLEDSRNSKKHIGRFSNILKLNDARVLEYIELICEFEISLCLKYIKTLSLANKTSSFVDKLIIILKKSNCFDCLIYIYGNLNNDAESLNEIIKFLQYNFINIEDLSELENNTWKYFSIAIKNCSNIEKSSHFSVGNQNKNHDSFLKLFLSLNNLIKLLKLKNIQQEKVIILKRFITEIFTSIDDKNMKNIINEYFINGKISINSSIDQINEIFENLQHQNLKLNKILKLYNNQVVSKNMESLSIENLKGYCLNLSKCCCCDKVLYGKLLKSDKYLQFWEFQELSELYDKDIPSEEDMEEFSDLRLVIFKCGHGYHLKCLLNLGETEDNLSCVLCSND